MATITAVAGGGNWNATGTWDTATVPTAADDVVLAATSGAVTITAAAVCRSLDASAYTSTLTHNATFGLTIGTSTAPGSGYALRFNASMTYTLGSTTTSVISFVSTSATQLSIDYGGKTTGNQTFNGAGGSWLLTGALTATAATITFSGGTLNTNGQTISCNLFTCSGSIARVLTLGASSITVAGGAGWTLGGSNFTLNAGTSTITMSSTGPIFAGGGATYYNVTFSTVSTGTMTVTGANTFNNLTTPTLTGTVSLLTFGASQTINGALTANGSSTTARLLINSTTPGTQVTLTAAAVSFQYADFQDIVGAGAASWNLAAITGLSGDWGNNSGITFTTGISQTMTLTASVNWTVYAWATRIPLAQDDVTVLNNSGASKTLTFNNRVTCRNIDFSGIASAVPVTPSTSGIFGNWTGSSLVSNTSSSISFKGRGTQTITASGGTYFAVFVDVGNGTVRFLDTFTGGSNLNVSSGTVDLNGQTVTVLTYAGTNNAFAKTLSFNGGTLNLTNTAASTIFSAGSPTGTTCTDMTSGSAIVITSASTNTRTFAGNGGTYPELRYNVAGSTGQLTIGGSNTFAGITFSDATNARTLALTSSTTTTISTASGWAVNGTSGKLMSVIASTAGTPATLSVASGTVQSDYLSLKDSTATGGATFYAGSNSTNVSGNTGWKFPIVAAAGGGNWNATATWTGGVVPTSNDDVQLASTSGSVTINAAAACRSLDCTGYTGTLTHSASQTLSIGSSSVPLNGIALKLVAGMTYTLSNTLSSAIAFVSTSSTVGTMDFGGKNSGNLSFTGAGGSWQFASNHTCVGVFTHSNGTVDLNGKTFSWNNYVSNSGSTRALTMGASSIALGGLAPWLLTAAGMTLTAGTSSITISNNGATFTGGGMTYYALSLTAASFNGQTIADANTFTNLTVTGPAGNRHAVTLKANQTVTGTLTLNGNSATNRLLVLSDVTGTARTLTAAAVSASNLDLTDITGAGAASWNLAPITGLSGDCGGNNGITFTTPATQTWQGTSGGNWSDVTKWTSRVPLPQDNVAIASAFASQTITADMPRLGKNIDFTGTTGTLTWTLSGIGVQTFGGLTLVSAVTPSGSIGLGLSARGSATLTSAGRSFPANISIDSGGSFTLADDFTTTSDFSVQMGSLNLAGHNITSSTVDLSSAFTKSVTFGAGTWTLTSTAAGSVWNANATGTTLSMASGTITIGATATTTRTFTGGGLTYGTLTYTVAGSTGQLSILDGNTFGTINFSDASNARTLQLQSATTTTITSSFNVQGTSGKLMSLIASSAGSAATLSKASGIVGCDYLSVKDSTATGGAGWYAGAHSTNVSGNTGWTFATAPSIVTNTQGAVSRIAQSPAKTQLSIGRIAKSLTASQTSVGRLATRPTKQQTALSRIAKAFNLSQTATARLLAPLTLAQTAKARIQRRVTTTQALVARIATLQTTAQTASGRIAETISDSLPAKARIQIRQGIDQPAIGRIALDLSSVQSAESRIAQIATADQSAVARLAAVRLQLQTAVALILPGENFTYTQTATAHLAARQFAMQTATANIMGYNNQRAVAQIANSLSKTISAVAHISIVGSASQSAVSYIIVTRQARQFAVSAIRQNRHAAQTSKAHIVTAHVRYQSATASISNVPVDTPAILDDLVSQSSLLTLKVSAQ